MRSSLLLAHHSSPFISVISTANEHCTTGVQAFPPSHASVWLKVRFYLFAFYSRRAFLYSTTTSHPRAKPLRTCHLYQTEAMCALTRSMCVGNCSPHAALHSFSPERRKEKKRGTRHGIPLPVPRRARRSLWCTGTPAKQRGVGMGVPSPRCSGPPLWLRFPTRDLGVPLLAGGAQGQCSCRAVACGVAPGDVTAQRVSLQAAQWPRHQLRGPVAAWQLTHKKCVLILHRGRELGKTCPASKVTFKEIAKKVNWFLS